MAEKVSRILVVLANPYNDLDQRGNFINNACKDFIESCQNSGVEVDVLDLYNDKEFNPISTEEKDTKVIEYQIRIKKSQVIVFFHIVWWLTVPAILKGFIDKVFVSGFGYRTINKITKGLLNDKKVIVFAASEKPNWQINYIYGNVLRNFWQKGVLDYCGIQNKLYLFGNFRSVSDETINKWHKKIIDIAVRVSENRNILDLF